MSRHEGVSCDNCLKSNFEGKRFKCLICYDYDLCESCHTFEVETSRHLSSHPMQCILTKNEFELYYGGESLSPESPPSFVCPYCARLGFTEMLLREHVNKEHKEAHTEVVCPVCAAMPSGDPNLVTEDLANHLSMDHRSSRESEDPFASRHIRRRGMRHRNHRSMHFSGGPAANSAIPIPHIISNNNNMAPSRDAVDPIAELLSQLSGVRRSAQQLQRNVTSAAQLQELQNQLQIEQHRTEIRNQKTKQGKANMKLNKPVAKRRKEIASTVNGKESQVVIDVEILNWHDEPIENEPSNESNNEKSTEFYKESSRKSSDNQPPLAPDLPTSVRKASNEFESSSNRQDSSNSDIEFVFSSFDHDIDSFKRCTSASEIDQGLERHPNKVNASNSISQAGSAGRSGGITVASKTTSKKTPTTANADDDESSKYLLSCLDEDNLKENEREKRNMEESYRSAFVQELLLSMLSEDCDENREEYDSWRNTSLTIEKAIPVDCPLQASSSHHLSASTGEVITTISSEKEEPERSLPPEEKDVFPGLPSSHRVARNASSVAGIGDLSLGDDVEHSVVTMVTDSKRGHNNNRATQTSSLASRSLPVLNSERRVLMEASQWDYDDDDDDKDSDGERPPSPTPSTHRGHRLTGHVFASGSGPVRIAGPAALNNYGREEADAGNLNKTIR